MHTLLRDIRLSLKLLHKEKTFSATVLTTLAICIGANVAIFSVIHALLLEPLPYDEPQELVNVFNAYPGAGASRGGAGSVDFFQRREAIDAFADLAIFRSGGAAVGEPGSIERVALLRTTPSLFPLLRVDAALGRTFMEDEMEEGNHRKVLLTHAYWLEQFAGAPDAVGRDLRMDGEPYRIVGVLPQDFYLPGQEDARLVVPTRFEPASRDLDRWHNNNFEMVARLAPGATVAQAQAQIDALNQRLLDEWPVPNGRQILEDAGFSTTVVAAGPDLVRDVEDTLYMLWAGVGFVLLIGCVNIANLMLARAQSRTGEVATKLALGAPRSRIGTQVLTEAVVMGVVGGALGLGTGWLGLQGLLVLGADTLPRGAEIAIDASVIAFTLVLAVGAAVLFGSIPAAQVVRRDLSPVFRADTRTGTASHRAVLLRNGLVAGQVGLAVVMLVGAGLMLFSFRAALAVDPGFESEGVLTGVVSLPASRYEDDQARRQLWDRLRTGVEALPAVARAGLGTSLPFSGSLSSSVIAPEGYALRPGESLISPVQSVVSPGYFEALGVEMLEGRSFQESDGPDDARVIVIDRWLAHRYWPEGDALGRRMVWGAIPGQDSIPDDALYTIVGVVETIKHRDLTTPADEHVGAYYLTYSQVATATATLVAHARTGDAEELTPLIRDVLRELDAELPLFGIQTMRARVDDSLAGRRVPLVLLGVFAAVALFLAVIGIYGALAYTVSQRTREIGIRMAMGSQPGRVFKEVVARGLAVTGVGLAVGAVTAYALTRFIRSLLYGIEPTDPRVLVGVVALLATVSLAACVLPARRATKVDPVSALTGR